MVPMAEAKRTVQILEGGRMPAAEAAPRAVTPSSDIRSPLWEIKLRVAQVRISICLGISGRAFSRKDYTGDSRKKKKRMYFGSWVVLNYHRLMRSCRAPAWRGVFRDWGRRRNGSSMGRQ